MITKIKNQKLKIKNKTIVYCLMPNAFTLIELLVSISIIGVLSTLILANFNAARERARDAQRKSDLRQVQNALRVYYNDVGIYPRAINAVGNRDNGRIPGCGTTSLSRVVCEWGSTWSLGNNIYIDSLPKDPKNDPNWEYYYYEVSASVFTDTYSLYACLENESDRSGKPEPSGLPASWCPTDWIYEIKQM